jgi:hypothetical protein
VHWNSGTDLLEGRCWRLLSAEEAQAWSVTWGRVKGVHEVLGQVEQLDAIEPQRYNDGILYDSDLMHSLTVLNISWFYPTVYISANAMSAASLSN